MHSEILQPVVALLVWTFVMWVWMYATRIPAISQYKIELDPNVPPRELMNKLPPSVRWKADNYNHLMEAPTLFYAVALTLAVAGAGNGGAATVAWGLVWFVVGYALYAAAYGALGALVGRQQEVGQVTAPLAMLLLAGYLSAAFAAAEPDGTLATVLSLLPPLAPLVMPVRIAAGAVGAGEIAIPLVLTLALAAALLALGARVYREGITRTGARISLREALGGGSR